MHLKTIVTLASALLAAVPAKVGAQDAISVLRGDQVREAIYIEYTLVRDEEDNAQQLEKGLVYAIDAPSNTFNWRQFEPGLILSSSRDVVAIVYHNFNPLKLQARAFVEDVDDPSQQAIVKLITALLQVPTLVAPPRDPQEDLRMQGIDRTISLDGVDCPELQDAIERHGALDAALHPEPFSGRALATQIETWSGHTTTAAGIATAQQLIAARHKVMQWIIDGDEADKPSGAPALLKKGAKQAIEDIEKAWAASKPTNACTTIAHTLYATVILSNPRTRLEQLKAIAATVDGLRVALDTYKAPRDWPAPGQFIFARIPRRPGKFARVSIRTVELSYETSADRLVVAEEAPQTATFDLYRNRGVVFEPGAGLLRSTIKEPKYGIDNGNVVRLSESDVSYDAALMINAVLRTGMTDTTAFMFQGGVSANKDVPAVFGGGGLRLFGEKLNVGIAIGAVIGWVNELDEGVLNKPGTDKTIAEGLTRNAEVKPYFMIQYNF